MNFLKILSCAILIVLVGHSVSAEKYTINGQVFAQNQYGQLIPQYWLKNKDKNSKKKAPKYKVSILGYSRKAEIQKDGKFKFKLVEELFPFGMAVTFSVDKNDSKIISPLNGKTFLPNRSGGTIELVLGFKERKKQDLYSVQILSIRNETRAAQLRNDLAKDLIISKSKERRKIPIFIEKYMVSNMPDNGYDYKVKVGAFREKGVAVLLKKDLERRYQKITGMFITLKGHK